MFIPFEYFPFNFCPSFKNLFKSVDSFWNFNTNLNFPHEKSQIPNFPYSFFFPHLEVIFELENLAAGFLFIFVILIFVMKYKYKRMKIRVSWVGQSPTVELVSQRITIQMWRACNPLKICKWAGTSSNSLSQSYSEKFPRQIFEGASANCSPPDKWVAVALFQPNIRFDKSDKHENQSVN